MTTIKVSGCEGDVNNVHNILETMERNRVDLKKSNN